VRIGERVDAGNEREGGGRSRVQYAFSALNKRCRPCSPNAGHATCTVLQCTESSPNALKAAQMQLTSLPHL
jgi:hypothetical protein